ncbi:restriction endonuclease subunit S [Metapseudomonas otitidis]|uniref:restriction endonuclease subunit S n=1 Tax=Metapseudomonas otitidis TaxID=319939 RepID=UPI0013F67C29|nr:restriction endonuclease subunit S [Pseudomonas otitidis]
MNMYRLLSDVAKVSAGHSFRGRAEDSSLTDGARVIQIKDIREEGGGFDELPFSSVQLTKLDNYLRDDDVLIPLKGSRIESMVVRCLNGGRVIVTNQIAIIRPNKELLDPGYLSWYINSSVGRDRLSGLKVGSAISSMSLKDLTSFTIPTPCLSVQEKIVKIHENWKGRRKILSEMLDVGSQLSESVCLELLEGERNC